MVKNRVSICHGRFAEDDEKIPEGSLYTEWQGKKIELNSIKGADNPFVDKLAYPLECEITRINGPKGSIKYRILRILNFK